MLYFENERVFGEYSVVMTDMIAKLYKHCGYSVSYCILGAGETPEKMPYIPDLMLEKDGERAIVEIIAPRSMTIAQPVAMAKRFLERTTDWDKAIKRILVLVCDYPNVLRDRWSRTLKKLSSDVEDFEIKYLKDLLNMVSDDAELYAEFTSLLPKPVALQEDKPPKTEFNDDTTQNVEVGSRKTKSDELLALIKEVKSWQVCDRNGNNRHKEYEKLCVRVLKALFHDELGLWDVQPTTLDGLNRFDIVCKIKAKGNDFWDILEQHFHSKYIIFECKNYQDPITQREVYTTEKYLYSTALRRVAIVVSVNGTGESAEKAIRGVLRETGKLIISVTNRDLVRMLEQKQAGQDPAVEVLGDLLDTLLVKLEK